MIVHETMEPGKPLTEEEKKMLAKAREMPISYDDDSPELSDEELAQFYRVSEGRPEKSRACSSTVKTAGEVKNAACRPDATFRSGHFIIFA